MEKTTKLTFRQKLGYGMGDAGGCMTFGLMQGFFTRYCLNILGIGNGVLAVLLLIWNLWDAISNPLMGVLMDKAFAKRRDARGKFRPWLLRSAPVLCISAITLWTVPPHLNGMASLAVLFLLKILYETAYTMFNIAMGSLLSAMSDTDEERAALSSARGFGAMSANMIALMLFPLLIEQFGDTASSYGWGASICALIGAVLCLGHYAWTEERTVSDSEEGLRISDIFHVFRVNRPFVALCLHGICINCMSAITSAAGTYMYEDVLGSIGMMSMATVISVPMNLVVLSIAPKAASKFGLERMIRFCLLLGSALYAGLFAVQMVMPVSPWVYIVWSSLAQGSACVSVLMQWGMVGQTIDYNERLTGKRTEGSIYGTFNLMRRLGTTIGSSASVLLLGWFGYDAAAMTQTATAITGIKVLYVLLPSFFAVGSWAVFRFVWKMKPSAQTGHANR